MKKKKKELVKSTKTNFELTISRLKEKANPGKLDVILYCILIIAALVISELALDKMENNFERFKRAGSYYNIEATCECGRETLTATDHCTECGLSSDLFTVVPNAYCSKCDLMLAPFEEHCPNCGNITRLATDTGSITIGELGYDSFVDFKAREFTYIMDVLFTLGMILLGLLAASLPIMSVWDMIICKIKLEAVKQIYDDLGPALKAIYIEDKKHKKEKIEIPVLEEDISESEMKDGE